jgi:hypothetical protein
LELIPWIGETRQIGGLGIHLPLFGPVVIIVGCIILLCIERWPQPVLLAIAIIGTIFYPVMALGSCMGGAFGNSFDVVVPLIWVPAAWVYLRSRFRSPRYPKNHCQSCGYDLTGNVSGRCPECGTVISVPLSSLSDSTT